MSSYGAPGTPRPGSPPAAGPPGRPGERYRPNDRDLPLFDVIGTGLGALSFIWGFLHFVSLGGQDVKGYEAYGNGIGPIGLSILASAIGGAVLLSEKATPVRPPYALAAAVTALLVTFGAMVGKGQASVGFGLVLLLVTTLGQVAAFGYAWLLATGRVSAVRPNGPAPPYGQLPPYGRPPAYQPTNGQPPTGLPGYGQPPTYGGPGSYYGQPPGYGSPSAPYGQPPTYGSPSYGQPASSYAPPPQAYGAGPGFGPPPSGERTGPSEPTGPSGAPAPRPADPG